ncbi:hypothetical protein N7510_000301 [Penicillium lagena]|uniref:uncharacterized protein n=1 Tax=Penicillium lagena TaxID=94218 RepID=UPI00254246EE|nr:uncharacterized protein N7510_000301 [Penicillium lagena]KAJ5623992.1 hypothetical protein N7510_000301 [Penicillium lagena]
MQERAHVPLLAHGLPFNPATGETIRVEFIRRAGVSSWDDLAIRGEARAKLMDSLRATLAPLATMFERDVAGSFLLGAQVSYAEFIVGGWLRMMGVTMPPKGGRMFGVGMGLYLGSCMARWASMLGCPKNCQND